MRRLLAIAFMFASAVTGGADTTPAPAPAPIAYDCATTTIPGFDGCPIQWAGYAGTASMFSSVANRTAVALSRVQADVFGPVGSHVIVRVETAARPGQESGTYASAGIYGGLYRGIGGELAAVCAGGFAFPLDAKDQPASAEYGCGPLAGKPRGRRWVMALLAHSDSLKNRAGGYDKTSLNAILPQLQFPLKGETYAFAGAGVGLYARDYYALAGVLVHVGASK